MSRLNLTFWGVKIDAADYDIVTGLAARLMPLSPVDTHPAEARKLAVQHAKRMVAEYRRAAYSLKPRGDA